MFGELTQPIAKVQRCLFVMRGWQRWDIAARRKWVKELHRAARDLAIATARWLAKTEPY